MAKDDMAYEEFSEKARLFGQLTREQALQGLLGGAASQAVDLGPGDLQAVQARIAGQEVLLLAFDYGLHQGSIGRNEATQCVAALARARHFGQALVVWLHSSGIRVTDSTAGLASLRKLLREAQDARLEGVRMLALVQRYALGGASLLAALCEQQVVHEHVVFAMSGPRLIEAQLGRDQFDAGHAPSVLQHLGGAARAQVSQRFVAVPADMPSYRAALLAWLQQPRPAQSGLASLMSEQQSLLARWPQPVPPWQTVSAGPWLGRSASLELLEQILGQDLVCSQAACIVQAQTPGQPGLCALVLEAGQGTGYLDAVLLSGALLGLAQRPTPPQHCYLIVNSPSHAGTLADEQALLSQALAHLSLVVRWLHRAGCAVEMVVSGLGGGGIFAALSSGASRVSMGPAARLQVLPALALKVLNKPEDPQAGALAAAVQVGAVDQAFVSRTALGHGGQSLAGEPSIAHNIYSLFARQVAREPAAACLQADDGLVRSRSELERLANRYAQVLRASGCQAGDRVAVQVDKSAEALALYLACMRAGLCLVPLNTAYQEAELAYLLADAQPALLVCRPERLDHIRAVAPASVQEILSLDAAGQGSLTQRAQDCAPVFETVARHSADAAALLYTSGTTGRPKGAMVSHGALMDSARVLCQAWQVTQQDVLLHALPIFHAHGLFVAANVALAAGACMLFQHRFTAQAVLAALPRASMLMGVPTFYHRLLAQPGFDRALCRHMRVFISGSAPLTAQLHAEFEQRTGHRILERYGATETLIVCSNPLLGERRAGSVGQALPGVTLRVRDNQGQDLPEGGIGMIEVRGPGVFQGYWGRSELARQDFSEDGFFRTGDLGWVDAVGYVTITGRAKDLIISAGYNVYPMEVEQVLDAYPGIGESAVFGVPHADYGEVVLAAVVLSQPQLALPLAEVLAWVGTQLAYYKVPRQLFVVEDFPRNALGKVQKNEMRRQFAERLLV